MNDKKVFYERGSWYHRTKKLEKDYSITYGKKGGFKTPEDANESYEKHEQEFLRETQLYTMNIDRETSFSNYLIYWYTNIFSKRKIENTYLLGVTYAIYNLILPLLADNNYKGDIKLRLITANYLNTLLESLSKITESAGNKCREVLNLAINDAFKANIITYNPMQGVDFYKRKQPKIKILRKNEIKLLLKNAKYDNWYLEILLGLFCGLRKGEIMGLKFSDFDIPNCILRVRRQLVNDPKITKTPDIKCVEIEKYVLVEKPPKKDSYRNIRVPQIIVQELLRRKSENETYRFGNSKFNEEGYISFNKETGKPHIPNSFNGYLYKICPKIGIPNISVHGLRHMFATILIEQGVPLAKISALLGHSSVHTTFEIYCDVMEEREKILEFVNNTFNKEMLEAM